MNNFFLFFFSLGVLVNAQESGILVQYSSNMGNFSNKETLIARGSQSIYITDALLIVNEKNANIRSIDESTNTIVVDPKTIKLDKTTYFRTLNSNKVLYNYELSGKTVMVEDIMPDFNWNLDYLETKKIGEYICNKATLSYRGSEIEAWYASKLQVPFGPWKFKGLPGLILELYSINDSVTHSWFATNIVYPFNQSMNLDYDKNLEVVSHQYVINDEEEQIRIQMERMNARAPKGVTSSNGAIKRTGIEKIFEWELKN